MTFVLRNRYLNKDNFQLSLLVIGNEFLLKPLCDSIYECNKNNSNKYNFRLLKCEKISDIFHYTNEINIDYIVFVLDTRMKNCVQQVENNLKILDKTLVLGRTCIVNGMCHLPHSQTGVSINSIIGLKRKYDFPLLNGHIPDSDNCMNLANRIFNLIHTQLGLNRTCFNMPFITWLEKP